MSLKSLPIGIDGFDKIRTNEFYYVDKTMFIAELLNNWGEVNLFTRPRRFGKSLNMSMLKAFFEIGCDGTLFNGLKISEEEKLCQEYMGRFPVVSITLKAVDGLNYQEAVGALRSVIGTEAMRFLFLEQSSELSEKEKEMYRAIVRMENGVFAMSNEVLLTSIKTLSQLLSKHYGQRVVILIDEYDVPLDKAFRSNYYNEMILMIRNLFGNALKGNDSLHFAVLTGCLRIYCDVLRADPDALPENYWANTSGNDMVKRFVRFGDQQTRDEIEQLIAGNVVAKEIDQELTYAEPDGKIDNLWSVLLTTGYLTVKERLSSGEYCLVIPNREIRDLFVSQVREWFRDTVEAADRTALFDAVWGGDADAAAEIITDILFTTISYHDYKESYYHAFIAGLFAGGVAIWWNLIMNMVAADRISLSKTAVNGVLSFWK